MNSIKYRRYLIYYLIENKATRLLIIVLKATRRTHKIYYT